MKRDFMPWTDEYKASTKAWEDERESEAQRIQEERRMLVEAPYKTHKEYEECLAKVGRELAHSNATVYEIADAVLANCDREFTNYQNARVALETDGYTFAENWNRAYKRAESGSAEVRRQLRDQVIALVVELRTPKGRGTARIQ